MKRPFAMHIPGNGDVCPLKGGMYVRLRTERGKISSVSLVYQDNKFDWWVSQKEAPMKLSMSSSDQDFWTISLPTDDARFAYVFRMTDRKGKTWWHHEEGVTEDYDNSLSFLNYFQYTSQFEGEYQSLPEWTKSCVCYQIFPERFRRGMRNKDDSYINKEWGELPEPKSFFGGDLEGIRKELPYLEELGINLLYLTPVFRSISNHKYDIRDYENVDESFGGNEALRDLIRDCHERGIRVMLDGVFNHCSNLHPFFLDVTMKGKDSKYADWFYFPEGEKPSFSKCNYRTFAAVPEMPKLNTRNPEVIDYFSGVAVKWMRDYGADAWRLDVSDEISRHFLRTFRDRVTAEDPDAIVIGEDWHAASGYLSGDMYDGVMNYGLMKALMDLLVLGTIDASGFRDRMVNLWTRHSPVSNRKMMNLLDSHDTDRFLERCGGDGRKHRAAMAVQFFWPGFPSVYYGDETGLRGGYDPDCRRCFDWERSHWDSETFALVKRLIELRKGKVLSEGELGIDEKGGIVTISRTVPGESITLRFNATGRKKGDLGAWGFEIIEEKE